MKRVNAFTKATKRGGVFRDIVATRAMGILMFALLYTSVAHAQTTIYSEDFTASNGTTSGTYWYIDVSGCSVTSSKYLKVQSNKMEARSTQCEATWYTYPIDISQYSNVSVSADVTESGGLESSDRFQMLYSIDGGAFQHFATNGNKYDDFSSMTTSQSGLSGRSLVIKFIAENNSSDEYYRVDNLVVEGTSKDNFSISLNSTNGSCSSTGAIDLALNVGSASGSTTSPYGTDGCTVTLSGWSSYTLNSGQVGCVTGSFNGSVTINGGTLINAGSANISTLNFYSGTFINNGSLAISNFTAYGGRVVYNYGSMSVSGTLTIGDAFYNYGSLSAGSVTLSSGGGLLNTNDIQVSDDFTNNSYVINSGSISVGDDITNNSSTTFVNNGTLSGSSLTLNGYLDNHGSITINGNTTLNSAGSVKMNSGSLLTTDDITINGPISNSGSACANIAVADYTRVNSSGSMSGNVQLCDATGVDINWSSNYSGGAGLNCNCSGGGYTYLWSNGATTQDISGLSAGTYTVTVTGPSGTTATASATITGGGASGDPNIFGSNVWNVYAWNSGNSSGGNGSWSSNYSGYYVINSLNFDTRTGQTYSTAQSWNDNSSPSSAAGYVGCTVGNDNHSYAFKREGFPCGNYTINLPNNDDRVELYVNGVQVYYNNTCCSAKSNVWSGFLGSTSTLELRISEGGGGSHGSIQLVKNNDLAITSSSAAMGQTDAARTLTANANGGSWSGTGVSGNSFAPATAGAGTHTITYTLNGCTATQQITVTAAGNPADFGSGVWNVYAWNAGDASGNNGAWTNSYSGYYVINSLNFDTRTGQTYSTAQSWADNLSPSSAAGYQGTPVGNDNHSYAFKRQGFPCGYYRINLPNHDDRVQLYVNGVLEYDLSGCCASKPNIWSGFLGASSTLELRIAEGGGGSHGSIELEKQYDVEVLTTTPASRCGTGTVTLQATATSGCVIDWYAAASGGSVLSGGTGTNSFTTLSISSTTTYYAQARHAATGCVSSARTAVTATIGGSTASSISGANTICAGGSSTFTATGGGTYAWSTGAATAAITVSTAGTYTVTVTNGGCTGTASRTLTVNSAPSASISGTNTICSGGSSTFTATGGGTYAWSTGATTAAISINTAGTFTVTVTAANGCTATANRTLTVNSGSASISGTQTICAGGSSTFTATGGGTYAWSTGATTAAINVSTAGTYTVTVTNGGCTGTASRTLTVNSRPTLTATATNVSCGFCTDGTASVSVSGGTSPYTYAWSTGSSSASLTGRSPGTYTVTVTDNLGCTATASATVNLPLQINIAGASACTAGSGSATASGTGGAAPYTFVWSTGATTATISSLTSGTYYVTGTDAAGVTASQSVVISNTNIVASMSPASASICQGQSVQLTASGADLYTWSPSTGLSNANIANPIATPTATTVYSLNVGAISGELVTNGNFDAGNTGFTSAYGVVYAPGNSNKLVPEGLYAVDTNANNFHYNFFGKGHGGSGKYMIINGATLAGQTIWSQTVNITPNTNYNFSTWITSVNASSPAQLRFEINGVLLGPVIAAPSTLHTWVPFNTTWNSGSATSAVISIVNENAAAGGNDYGLDDISFTTVCNVNHGSVTVTVNPIPTANAGNDQAICNGSSASLSASGAGSGGTYAWSSGGSSAATSVSPSSTTTYTVTVTNSGGCSATDAVNVTVNALPVVSVSGTNVNCHGASTGTATVSVSGGTSPYSYNWGGGVTTQNRTGLAAGSYTITVTTANGCTASGSVTITQPAAALSLSSTATSPTTAGGSNGSIDLSVSGGTTNYTYNWSNGATTQDISSLTAATYTVTVTDAAGCTATRSTTVTAPQGPCTCIATGNWSNPNTWSGNCSGGGGLYAGYLDDIEIKGFKVTVDSAHTVKSLVLKESTSDTTRLLFTGTNSLNILEEFGITTSSSGKNVEIDIDGSAELRINGDFNINHNYGKNVEINLNDNDGNNAKLLVEGNLVMTLGTNATDLFINTYATNDTIQVNGSLLFKNNNTSSGDDITVTMRSSSKLIVQGDIDFNGVRNQNMELILNNSSVLELGGSIIRKASPSKFGKITMNSSSSLVFNGIDQQIWEGTTGNTDNNSYRAVTIRNTSPTSPQVLLNGDVTVTSTLVMEDGNIGTGNNMVILSSTSASALSGHSANSYIVGTLRRYIASNFDSYDFPLGYGGTNEYYWARINNNLMIGPTYLTASFGELPQDERNQQINVIDDGEIYTELNQTGIWTIDPNTQPILGSYTIEVGINNFSGLVDGMFRLIKRPTRSGKQSWSNGNIPRGLLNQLDRLVANGKTGLSNLTSFSDFGIAQGNGSGLPIDLLSFGAQPDGERVRLDWTVSMEINNDYFTIERSLDGVEFEPIIVVEGAGNHSIEKKYQTYDENPEMGLSYYRLKQTDFDGASRTYDMVSVTMTSTAVTKFDIVPNPNRGSFTIHLDTPFDQINVMILNSMGQMVYFNELLGTTGKTKTQLDLGDILATGMYFVKVDSGKDTFIKQMVIE